MRFAYVTYMTEIKTKRFFACPNGCKQDFPVEHLLMGECGPSGTAGPWGCDDCGDSWNVAYTSDSISVTRAKAVRRIKHHVILELPPQTSPVRFRLTTTYDPRHNTDDNTKFFYESHSCPTNWLRDIDVVEFEGDRDPHGLIKFVCQFDATPESLDENADQPYL